MNEKVPVERQRTTVPLSGGGTAQVVRLRHGDQNDVFSAAKYEANEPGMMRLNEMAVRASVVDCQGLVDPDTKAPIVYSKVRHPEVGMIAHRDIFNAMSTEDHNAVLVVAFARLSETQAGN